MVTIRHVFENAVMRWVERKKRGIKMTQAVTSVSYWQTVSWATLILFGILIRAVYGIPATNVSVVA